MNTNVENTGIRTRKVSEHRNAVAELLADWLERSPLGTEVLPLAQASGRVLAEDILAPRGLPPFANSQMDGYAVRSGDLAAAGTSSEVPVAAPIPAGKAAPGLVPGTAAPIMTGAMLPAGADAVVPIEHAVPDSFPAAGSHGGTVSLPGGVPAGQFVRPAGSDITAGTLALATGTRLGAAQLGLLAGLGIPSVPVCGRFRVLLLSTGDEVVEPGSALAPGQIHDANSTLLAVSLHEAGAEVLRSRVLADQPDVFLARLREDLAGHRVDLVLTSGGISKGAFEVVRQALDSSGVQFLSVAMQPGGPQGIGSFNGVPFLGFPGNPVSCLVSFEMFLRPVLSDLTGLPVPRTQVRAVLAQETSSPQGKLQVRRGRYADGTVTLVGGPGSHLVHALASSNALALLPEETGHAEAGDEVTVWLLE